MSEEIKKEGIDELLGIDKFNVDEDNAHIVIDKEHWKGTPLEACLVVCPAKLYKLNEKGQMVFDYAGCFECGTCRVMCHGSKAMKKWEYPQGTFGISYRFG